MSTERSPRRTSNLAFESALTDAGGVSAPRERLAGLRAAFLDELAEGAAQLGFARSGYRHPVAVAFAVLPGLAPQEPGTAHDPGAPATSRPWLIAVAPVDQALRVDPGAVGERAWLLTAGLVGAMVQAAAAAGPVPPGAAASAPVAGGASTAGGAGRSPAPAARGRSTAAGRSTAPATPGRSTAPGRSTTPAPPAPARSTAPTPALDLRAGALGKWLVLALPLAAKDSGEAAELAVLAFEDEVAGIDRLRARSYAVPSGVLDGIADVRLPIGQDHPLRAAEVVARLGGRPADEASVAEHEEGVLAVLGVGTDTARPHEEQDPALRAARRILQRLAGMGKWGGYHTDVAHLARGFAGNERALAIDVGERLVSAGLLVAKPSVGQRHVFLNPRRAGDIHALIERGIVPAGLELPRG
ncbi:MAG TPA: hypothetical protein VG295_10815 [Solirubrobacteraceae bacterium]|nr:hypothetical protein [Solirubrobacteraceae bacterium]